MPATPSWFTAALDQKPERCDVEVDGCRIRMRVWGAADQPPVVLVHGGGAHSGWWDHIAPFFSRTHRVIAPDLSGHGDSDPRDSYDLRIWAGEVMAAAAAAGPAGRPTIVGHSMGGWVVSTAAMHYSSKINSMLVIDSPLWERAPEEGRLRRRKHTEYRTRNEILARFTAVPRKSSSCPMFGSTSRPSRYARPARDGCGSSIRPFSAVSSCSRRPPTKSRWRAC